MKKIFVFIILLASTYGIKAQVVNGNGSFLQDVNGKPLATNTYTDIEGSPYLPENWTIGSIKLNNGAIINYNALRFNLATGELEFQKDDKPFVVINPFQEFTIVNMLFRKGFSAIDQQTTKNFYEVMYDGKVKLLSYRTATMYEEKPYNSATKTKKFLHNDIYYLQKADGSLVKVKKDRKAIIALLGDKTSQLEEYIKKENLKIRDWRDVTTLLAYYENL